MSLRMGFAMFVAGTFHREMVYTFHEMGEFDVRLDEFPHLCDGILSRLALRVSIREPLLDAVPHISGQLVRELIDVPVREGLVGGGDPGIGAADGLQSREAFSFARAMNPDKGFKEISIRHSLCRFTFIANCQRHLEGSANLILVFCPNPFQHRVHFFLGECPLSVFDNRTIHAVAVSLHRSRQHHC